MRLRCLLLLPLLLAISLPGAAPQHPVVRPQPRPETVHREGARGEREESTDREKDRKFSRERLGQEFHGNVLIETAADRRMHAGFRDALAAGDAVAAAKRLQELSKPGQWDTAMGRALFAELRARVQAESSPAGQRSYHALEKYLAWDRVELELVQGVLRTRARLVDPAFPPATPAQIGSRPVYIAEGSGLAAVDAGPPLRAAIQAGHRAGRLDIRRILDADLALLTPDRLTIESKSGR